MPFFKNKDEFLKAVKDAMENPQPTVSQETTTDFFQRLLEEAQNEEGNIGTTNQPQI